MKTVHLFSVVGIGDTDLGLLSLGRFGRRRRRLPHTIAWDGVTYLTGPHVAEYARPVERMDFLRLSDGPELRALTYSALGLLLGEGVHTASLMVGLPVEVMADKELARSTRCALRRWLVGAHRFSLDGQETILTIERVKVLPQPAGTVFAWGMNDEGDWALSPDDVRATVAVCDIGFNTLDLFTVQGGQVMARFTDGDTLGMRRAAELLAQMVRQQYEVDLSLHQADELLRQSKPQLHTTGQSVDLGPAAKQARDAAAGAVTAFLESRWGKGRQFRHLLFTGGGAEALRDELMSLYPYGSVLPDAVTANALGMARYARRVYKDVETVIGLDPGFGGFKAVALDGHTRAH